MSWFPLFILLLKPLVIRVTPYVLNPGGSVSVEVHVQPKAENRWLVVDLEETSSEFSLEGEEARPMYRRRYRLVEPGPHVVSATVLNGRQQIVAYAAQRVVVAEE